VSANATLLRLISEISSRSNVNYTFAEIDPVNDQDGGQPGGNIRVAYLYNPSVLRLHNPNPGSSTDANEVLPGPELKFNPGRIDPQNFAAWNSSRKPLAAAWETLDGKNKFFTIDVHFASKGGSSSIEGDARPPVNGVIDARIIQAQVTANFIKQILTQDKNARIITSGDFNEFVFAEPLKQFVDISTMRDLDAVLHIPVEERYTYLFDMNCQQLDHIFISNGVRGLGYEHIHLNSWATPAGTVSDHDPSVAKLNICQI
jgi:predicted extracellular nuclease